MAGGWTEIKDPDAVIGASSFLELRYQGLVTGVTRLPAATEEAASFIGSELRAAIARKGKAVPSVYYWDDLKEEHVVTIRAKVSAPLRQLRQPESVEVRMPEQFGGPGLIVLCKLHKTRLLVGRGAPDPLDPLTRAQIAIANAASTVGQTAEKATKAVTKTVQAAGDAVKNFSRAVPLGIAVVGIVALWLLLREARATAP